MRGHLQKTLTNATFAGHHPAQVLNTPQLAASAPVSHRGFFTSIAFAMAGSARPCNTRKGKSGSGLVAVLKFPPPSQQGRISTNQLGGFMPTPSPRTSAQLSQDPFARLSARFKANAIARAAARRYVADHLDQQATANHCSHAAAYGDVNPARFDQYARFEFGALAIAAREGRAS